MPPSRVSGARLDALVQNAREPVLLLGPERRIISVNHAWEELTGHSSDEVAGLECRPVGPTRPRDLVGLGGSFCPPPEAMDGSPSGSTTLILRADGSRIWRRVEFWPFHDAQGGLIGLLGLVRSPDDPPQATDSESQRLRSELMEVRDRLHRRHGIDALIGRGPEHRRLLDQMGAAASTNVPVLIAGEGGTGKRLVAQTIHHRGPRRQAPLLAYDCKALPPEVLERELFGGAGEEGGGRGLAAAEGATVLIGDVLDLPRDLQARLASGLDGRVRLIATTAGDPDVALASERLRPDLYFALTTLVIRLRPLRDRADELPLLAQHLLERINLRGERRREGFRPEALAALTSYDWPGNLRELARVIEEAHGHGADDLIGVDDIPGSIRGHRGAAYLPPPAPQPASLKDLLLQVERRAIERALARARQNKSRAAKMLGINRPLLYRRIKELGIPDEPGTDGTPPDPDEGL